MKYKTVFNFFGAKNICRFLALLVCAFAGQILTQAQTLVIQGEENREIKIPHDFRDNSDAVQRALLKQDLLPMPDKNFLTPAANGEKLDLSSVAPQVGNIDPLFPASITDGTATVNAVAVQADGKILIGGLFSNVNGASRRSLERLNADGSRDATFNPNGASANATVYIIIPLSDGKILIGGSFTTYNTATRGRIARLNADGSLDTSFVVPVGANNSIQDMIVQPDGKILISGNFTSYDGTVRNRVARLNADGSLDAAFNPNVNGFTEELVLQPDGKIVIGGIFTQVGTTTRNSVARLNADGTVDTSFNPGAGAQFWNGNLGSVYALERQADGKIMVGGDFDFFGANQRKDFVRLNADGSVDGGFTTNNFSAWGSVEHFAIQPDGKILVAGIYNFGVGTSRYALLRFNSDGSSDFSFGAGPTDDLGYVLALQTDGKVIFGGYFTGGVKRLNANGSADTGFNASVKLEATVRAIKIQPDGKILIGGDFRFVNGTARRNLARLNADGSLDTSLFTGIGPDNVVFSIGLEANGNIFIGGLFTSINNTQRNLIARLTPDGNIFDFNYLDAVGTVYDIEVQPDGKVVLGGFFDNPGLQINSGIVRLLPTGGYDTPSGYLGANGFVTDVEVLPDGKYLIGGSFTTHGSTSRNRIARLNADLSLDTAFDPGTGANSTVWDVVPLGNGQTYLAGAFSSFNGNSNYQDLVRLSSTGAIDQAFASGTGFNGTANTLLPLPDGKILVGGNFFSYQSTPINHLAQINPNGTLDTSFNSFLPTDAFFFVWKLVAQPDGKVLVGGRFNTFANLARNSLVRLSAVPRKTPFDFDGDGRADFSVFRPSERTWYINRSTAGFAAAQFGLATDRLAPADYDGDGKTDIGVFRDGVWWWLRSSDNNVGVTQFGIAGDIAQPGDYDGDGKDDKIVFRQGIWYIQQSSDGASFGVEFGAAGDRPVAADYNGDGKVDLAVYRDGLWRVRTSSNGSETLTRFGIPTDKPVQADYDGDAKTDFAVYRDGTWWILRSSDGVAASAQFGIASDTPAPADYDGDARADIAVFRSGVWYVQKSTDNAYIITQFGLAGDKPAPAAFIP